MLPVSFVRYAFPSTFLLGAVLLAGCGPGGGGGAQPRLSQKVEFLPRYNIEKAVVTVFQMDGFQLIAGRKAGGAFQFVRRGDVVSQERFGDWFDGGVQVRADVTVTEVEFGTHQVSCILLSSRAGDFVPTEKGDRRVKALLKRVEKLAGVL
ncbi:MAG: hypothetical protein CMP28_11245 [Roseibacillus sp.]|nr:hypothetical protein [Roseibacillus sp.]